MYENPGGLPYGPLHPAADAHGWWHCGLA